MNQARKPRVCLLTETYHPVVGGGETQARALAEGLAAQGYGVLVITRRSDDALPRQEQIGPVAVYRVPPAGPSHLKKWGLLLTSGPPLLRHRRQYDVLFVSGFRVVGVTAVLAGKLFGKRCILKADSLGEMSGDFFLPGLARLHLSPSSRLFRLFQRIRNAILRRADAFVAIAGVIADELTAGGIPPERIRRIPNSVDDGRFHPVGRAEKAALRGQLGLPLSAPLVIFTGRLVSYKGLPLLLRAWQAIWPRHADARLLLVGAGGLDIHNCEVELKAYVAQQGLQASVCFTGNVANVHEYLQAADIFAFPTENEALPLSLIEAMACGLAVIGSDVGGLKDILQDGQNGLVIPAGDLDRLVAALEALLADATLRERLGQAARHTVVERYTTASVTRQYAQLFASSTGECSS